MVRLRVLVGLLELPKVHQLMFRAILVAKNGAGEVSENTLISDLPAGVAVIWAARTEEKCL